MTTPADAPPLVIKRPFKWGILVLSDAGSKDIPASGSGAAFSNSRDALVVAVRHSADVVFDAEDLGPDDVIPPAEVSVRVGPGNHQAADYGCMLDLPSGELRVGDADHEDAVTMPPGRYAFSVAVNEVDYADEIDVRWSPAG